MKKKVNSKKKGNRYENKLANWLRDHGLKAWKDASSGGGSREKGDVGNNLDMTIESKACKNISLMEWWRQVNKSASMHRNSPVLFIHQDGMPDKEWLVVMHSEDWVEYVKDALKNATTGRTEPQREGSDERQALYDVERARVHLKQALKKLSTD